jgi:hypothetical protein
MNKLVLRCTVHDESAQLSLFKVTISAGADVDTLKEAIKKKMEHALFGQFDADTLTLWKVRSSQPVLTLLLTHIDSSTKIWFLGQRTIFPDVWHL